MNDEFIKRADLDAKLEHLLDKCGNAEMAFALNWALKMTKEILSADVCPVVHARWDNASRISRKGFEWFKCSNCGMEWSNLTNFCPNCGAKMEAGDES